MSGLAGALSVAVATGFYLSYIPEKLIAKLGLQKALGGSPQRWTGSGFVGTLEGWAALYALPKTPWVYLLTLAVAILAACWISGRAERELRRHDDPRIVIDEIVGYWVTMALLPRRWETALAGFIAFRFLDSVKLPPYRRLEQLPDGYGVVLDDVGAGIFANILLRMSGSWISG